MSAPEASARRRAEQAQAAPRGERRREWPLILGLAASAAVVLTAAVWPLDQAPAVRSHPVYVPMGAERALRGMEPESDSPGDAAGGARAEPRRRGTPAAGRRRSKRRSEGRSPSATGGAAAGPTAPDEPAHTEAGAGEESSQDGGKGAPAGGSPKRKDDSKGAAPRRRRRADARQTLTGDPVDVEGNRARAELGPCRASFSAPTHAPRVGEKWTMRILATKDGEPSPGRARVDVTFQGGVVGHIDQRKLRGGRYEHTVEWPERAIGHALTVKVTLTLPGCVQFFLYDVKVRAATDEAQPPAEAQPQAEAQQP